MFLRHKLKKDSEMDILLSETFYKTVNHVFVYCRVLNKEYQTSSFQNECFFYDVKKKKKHQLKFTFYNQKHIKNLTNTLIRN